MDVFVAPTFYDFYRANPLLFVDAGSRGGIPPHWYRASAYLQVLGFDPDPHALNNVEAAMSSGRELNVGLYNQKTTLDLNETREAGDSSLLMPNAEFLSRFPRPERYAVVAKHPVNVDTLDHVLDSSNISNAAFLKIDTQGSELYILEGAHQTLTDQLLGLEVEVEFAPMYCDQPRFSDVDRLITKYGFELFDLRPVYWKRAMAQDSTQTRGQIIYADVLYLAGIERLETLLSKQPEQGGKQKILHLIACALVYGYPDYALEVVQRFDHLFSATEQHALTTTLGSETSGSTTPSGFPGKALLVRLLERLLRRLETPTKPHWMQFGSGMQLGNLDSMK